MRKHEISYHEKSDIIEFISRFCTHWKEIKTKTTNKEKKISFEKKSFFSQSNHVKTDSLNKNSKSMIVIKVLSRKQVKSDQSAINLSRKDKKSTTLINKSENINAIKDFRFNLNELEIFNSKKKEITARDEHRDDKNIDVQYDEQKKECKFVFDQFKKRRETFEKAQ